MNYKSPEYALYRLKNRLNYYQKSKPTIYEIVDTKGIFICSFTNKDWLPLYQTEEYVINELDLDVEMDILKEKIKSIESTINY